LPVGAVHDPLKLHRRGPLSTKLSHNYLQSRRHQEKHVMDKNRTEGAKHEIKGSVKEVVGVTGNKVKEAKGNAEKNIGKVQKAAGESIDKARKA
jgi:uncharacterized protein YjbJ (UPF0337 family)